MNARKQTTKAGRPTGSFKRRLKVLPLRMLRHSRGISPKDAADRMEISLPLLHHYENGNRKLSEVRVKPASRLYKVSMEVITVLAEATYKGKVLDPEAFVRLVSKKDQN